MPSPPPLVTWLDDQPWQRIPAPASIAPRAWILGVVAVQLTADGRILTAQARASVTGEPARTATLDDGGVLHVSVGEAAPPIAVAAPAAPGMALYLDGALVDEIALDARLPSARAVGHVYCRWLRSGELEPGFDLTDFQSLPPGVKYARRLNRALEQGRIVSYAIRLARVR